MGEKGEGIKRYKLVVTEYSWRLGKSTGNIVNVVWCQMGAGLSGWSPSTL